MKSVHATGKNILGGGLKAWLEEEKYEKYMQRLNF